MPATPAKTKINFTELTEAGTRSDTCEGQHRLTFHTAKASGGGLIYTTASVSLVSGGFETFVIYGDYRVNLGSVPAKRVTQKAIDAHHANMVTPEVIENVKADALRFYAEKAADKAA